MLKRKKEYDKGFLGAAKTKNKPPYFFVPRTPDMYPLGEKSNFITPMPTASKEEVSK